MTTDSRARRRNLLLITSDQHNPAFMSYLGHRDVQTPALDDLAAQGTVFTNAYCTSPICVPSRASMVTGRYVHETGHWDNAAPYTGIPRSWGHALGEAGYQVTTIGKLHYRDVGDDTGFPDQRLAMHVHLGGDLRGVSLRPQGEVPDREGKARPLLRVGSGETEYTRFDRAVATAAVKFLEDPPLEPWGLTVSFVAPHFPLIAPEDFYQLYDPSELTLPSPDSGAWDHPAIDVFKRAFGLSDVFTDQEKRSALRAYLALCSYLDSLIGRVLDALSASGQASNTLVVYTSDHGESAGAHGLWFKHLMNDESVGVPLIVAGPGVSIGQVVTTPVSHVDLFPTFLEGAGLARDDSLPGISLLDDSDQSDRAVMAEYHANGSTAASFMLRHGRYKYIEYVGERPQLFNLESDPDEMVDLARDPGHADVLADCARRLRDFCDPDEVDALAKADQARRVEQAGGLEAAAAVQIPYTPVPENVASELQ